MGDDASDAAEWIEENKQNILCKYFLHGVCNKGSLCPYGHDWSCRSDKVCKFYLVGSCSYGKLCRYDHVKSSKKISKVKNEVKTASATLVYSTNVSWIQATEFVPGRTSHHVKSKPTEEFLESPLEEKYSDITSKNLERLDEENMNNRCFKADFQEVLCPFAAVRDCPFGENCEYMHGLVCDFCGMECLHPNDVKQQKEHIKECQEHHEQEMEKAFGAQKSEGVTCSICLDIVREKANLSERMFGILENCYHPFCLSCIRKWRKSFEHGKNLIRTCPICRKNSWFITPSQYWVDNDEEKVKVINNYKSHLSKKHCRSFNFGIGECHFGTSCFYKHEYSDGSKQSSKPDLRYREGPDGHVTITRAHRLDEFIDVRER